MKRSDASRAPSISYVNSSKKRYHSAAAVCVSALFLFLCFVGCSPASGKAGTPAATPLPASQVSRIKLESLAMDATVPFLVYLPCGYTPEQKYPVWYAMHGYSSTENWWLDYGRAGERADALIAFGELTPMIMVFPMTRYDDAKTIEADMADGVRGPSRMERFLCDELVPYIDAHYSTIAAPEGRFIGGFSMGGLFALQIGLHQPGLFGKIGAYSPALTYRDFSGDHFERWLSSDPADATVLSGYAKAHGLDKLSIYLDCGGESDPFSAGAASLYEALIARGISTEFHPHAGGHSLDLALVDGYLLFYGG